MNKAISSRPRHQAEVLSEVCGLSGASEPPLATPATPSREMVLEHIRVDCRHEAERYLVETETPFGGE